MIRYVQLPGEFIGILPKSESDRLETVVPGGKPAPDMLTGVSDDLELLARARNFVEASMPPEALR